MKTKSTSKWQDVKDYVNSHEKFTRKEMTKFYNGDFGHTEDQYVLFLKHCGFLEKVKISLIITYHYLSSLIVE